MGVVAAHHSRLDEIRVSRRLTCCPAAETISFITLISESVAFELTGIASDFPPVRTSRDDSAII